MFSSIGPMELIIVLVVVLLIFGPKRLPGLGKQLGTGMREFKDSIAGKDDDRDDDGERRDATVVPTRAKGESAPLEGHVVTERERAQR